MNTLDAKHILCPMPVIRTQEKIATLKQGDTLEVTCTDPGALYDIPVWCKIHGHEILDTKQKDSLITITIEIM